MPDTSFKAARRAYYKSSSFKLAMFFAVLLGSASVMLGAYLQTINSETLVREAETGIDAELDYLLDFNSNQDMITLRDLIKERSSQAENSLYLLQDSKGGFLAGNLAKVPSAAEPIIEGVIGFSTGGTESHQVAAKIETFADGSRLLVGRHIDDALEGYERLKIASYLIIAFLLIVIFASFFVSVFVVSRINVIAAAAETIVSTGDLSQRISISQKWDDLSNLAQTLNLFLDKIESLMEGIQHVSDNIAHDLRTPLTRLKNQLECLDVDDLSQTKIDQLTLEADQLLGTFSSLLRISRLEMGQRRREFIAIDLASLLKDVIDLYEPLAEERQISIELRKFSDREVRGDRDLLFQVFANLIDNAIKFSPSNSAIEVTTFLNYSKLVWD